MITMSFYLRGVTFFHTNKNLNKVTSFIGNQIASNFCRPSWNWPRWYNHEESETQWTGRTHVHSHNLMSIKCFFWRLELKNQVYQWKTKFIDEKPGFSADKPGLSPKNLVSRSKNQVFRSKNQVYRSKNQVYRRKTRFFSSIVQYTCHRRDTGRDT